MIKSKNFRYDAVMGFGEETFETNHPPDQILIQIFSGVQDLDVIECCIETIKSKFIGASIIGVTTAGEIVDGESLDASINVNVTYFDETRVKSILITQNDDLVKAGQDIAASLYADDAKALIVRGYMPLITCHHMKFINTI